MILKTFCKDKKSFHYTENFLKNSENFSVEKIKIVSQDVMNCQKRGEHNKYQDSIYKIVYKITIL